MKKWIYSLLCLLLFVACGHREERQIARFQNKILEQCDLADTIISQVAGVLKSGNPDSVRTLPLRQTGYEFVIFGPKGLYYWSSNKLSMTGRLHDDILGDDWKYLAAGNAHTLCRWQEAGDYFILTFIPFKNNFPYENRDLHNVFAPCYNLKENYDVSSDESAEGYSIHDRKGNYLFSLVKDDASPRAPNHSIAESFSYRHLFLEEDGDSALLYMASSRSRIFFVLCLLLIFGFTFYEGYVVLRYWRHGLNLQQRSQLIIGSLLLVLFVSIFYVSTHFVRNGFSDRQRTELLNKTKYIQRSLQAIYGEVKVVDPMNSASLNVDLQEMSFLYKTDIHVYDSRGMYVGSSQPLLFSQGIVGSHISPQVFFSKNPNMVIHEHIGSMSYLCAYTELLNADYKRLGYIAVPLYISSDMVAEELDTFMSRLLPIFLLGILLAVFGSIWASRRITAPLNVVAAHMSTLQVDGPNQKIDYHNKDELGQLVSQYNMMVDALEASAKKLAEQEREGAWHTMASQIAHEVKNPLTSMRLYIQQLIRLHDTKDDRFDVFFEKASQDFLRQIETLTEVANSYYSFGEDKPTMLERLDVAEVLRQVVQVYRFNEQGVHVEYIGPEDEPVWVKSEKQVTQVFNNLVLNAIQAIGSGRNDGTVQVNLSAAASQVTINVIDNGCGIAEENREHIFEPKFTTKSTGTGIGLAVCKRIVEASQGRIYFTSTPGKTVFTVELLKA